MMGHKYDKWIAVLAMAFAPAAFGQQSKAGGAAKPLQAKSTSSLAFSVKDGAETVEITNVSYEVVGPIPGRAPKERLVLRKTVRSKQISDEIDMEASSTVEAWPLGVDLRQKPLYSLTIPGIEAKTVNTDLIVISRGLEEVDWWSIFKIGTGEHLFDTYVPLTQFSISRDTQTLRYVGLEVPPDDTSDARLKAPGVVGVLTYASADRVIREALITASPAGRAELMRSFADTTRTVALIEHESTGGAGRKAKEPSRAIRISFSQNFPSAPATVTITIPIEKDDLDVAHIQGPAGVRVAAWKR